MILMKHICVRAIDELDHRTFRESFGSNVQAGIFPTDCGDIHVLGCVICTVFRYIIKNGNGMTLRAL